MSEERQSGVLFGVGLGPGDPELVTLKAHRLISNAKVVAYPKPDDGDSFARSIAAGAICAAAEEIAIEIPMRAERFPAQAVYDAAAERIATRLSAGVDVVTLCEGDPFFYGSFMYLHARLAPRFRTVIVPGVTSMTACAAAWGKPLSARNEPLIAIPGGLADPEIEALLSGGGAAAILKVGRHLPRLKRLVERLGLVDRAGFVAHATLPQMRVEPLRQTAPPAPYFSMILIAGEDPYAHV